MVSCGLDSIGTSLRVCRDKESLNATSLPQQCWMNQKTLALLMLQGGIVCTHDFNHTRISTNMVRACTNSSGRFSPSGCIFVCREGRWAHLKTYFGLFLEGWRSFLSFLLCVWTPDCGNVPIIRRWEYDCLGSSSIVIVPSFTARTLIITLNVASDLWGCFKIAWIFFIAPCLTFVFHSFFLFIFNCILSKLR